MSNRIVIQKAYISELEWQRQGLQQTATGYGRKLTSRYMLQLSDGTKRRIYYTCFSNVASFWFIFDGDRVSIADYKLDDLISGDRCYELLADRDHEWQLIEYSNHSKRIENIKQGVTVRVKVDQLNDVFSKNMDYKITVEYKDKDGYRVKGLCLDNQIQKSTTGNYFLFVDDFVNRISVDRVIALYVTGVKW